MKNRKLWIVLGVVALVLVLIIGVLGGAALTYYFLDAQPVQAAIINLSEADDTPGVLISSVVEGSAAAEAGLVRGDILLEVNDREVNSLPELWDVLAELDPGDTVNLTVQHGDDVPTLSAQLGEREGAALLGVSTCNEPFGGDMVFDIVVVAGAEVVEVVSDSPAEQAGLQAGDVILSVDGEEIGPKSNLADRIQSYEPGDKIAMEVISSGDEESHDIDVTLGEDPDQEGQAYLGIKYRMGAELPGFHGGGIYFGEKGIPFFHRQEFEEEWPEDFGSEHFFFHGMPFEHKLIELPEGIESATIIGEVLPDTPAEKTGLLEGDVIFMLNGDPLVRPDGLSSAISGHAPGEAVTLIIYRDGEEIEVEVTLAEHPDNPEQGYLGVVVTGFISIEDGEGSGDFFQFDFNFDEEFEKLELPDLPGGDA